MVNAIVQMKLFKRIKFIKCSYTKINHDLIKEQIIRNITVGLITNSLSVTSALYR